MIEASLLRARRFVNEHPEDPRCVPFHRKDGYGRVAMVFPNPDGEGWLCPECAKPGFEFYGDPPKFEGERYVDSGDLCCLECFRARPGYRSPTRKGGQPDSGNP